ncbi:PREDICTED: pyridoxine-5'-phosphate oxidase-like [Polistes canadensis]|uniref:pyridoxine-5'-phosphate oxidase-like n=1 Tax=Polistes canadensis TaxID=91411 RepID=UPI000718C8DF|nr:PREDICTED: pyridoxine-5'-phosphate oxidase-like [Polistes canadensis]
MSDKPQDLTLNYIDIGGMRIRYKNRNETFTEDQLVSTDPIEQFRAWFTEACHTPYIAEPNAAFLGTATKDGFPSVRAVLLKDYNAEGFKFYTNYHSRKGREIEENPNVAMTLYWEPLHRAIRIEGIAEKTSAEDSDRYFHSRPYPSQIGSIASHQSSVIANRKTLIVREKELLATNTKETVKRPDYWGGYLIRPKSIEFWQGQSDRLHDRIVFRKSKPNEKIDNIFVHEGKNGWVYERLSP